MHIMRINLTKPFPSPLFCDAFYERIAEVFHLPSTRMLMKSLNEDIIWETDAKVYYVDNMIRKENTFLFQVKFLTSKEAKNETSIFLDISTYIQSIEIIFPARGSIEAGSQMIEIIKSLIHSMHVDARDVPLKIEGFAEDRTLRFIRESKLSAIVWNNGLKRYLHISENPHDVSEVRRGRKVV